LRYSGSSSQFPVVGQGAGAWYYRVRAANAMGKSPWSATQSTGVLPGAPTLFPIGNPEGDGDYLVDWSDVTGAMTYTLEEDGTAGFSAPALCYSGSSSQFPVVGQGAGTWYYRVRADNAAGKGPWSAAELLTVKAGVYLPLMLRNR
jgi:hypothetical protein